MRSCQEKNSQVENILNRLKIVLDIRKDKNLAKLLGVKPSTLSTWKARNTLDYELLINICVMRNINLNWLFTGQGSMFIKNKIKTEEERNLESRLQKLIKEKNSLEKKIMDLDKELQELDREFREICMRKDLKPKLSES
ncbi:MAG: helix-turn-helix domain-containing protein [Archaeoglobus sp.]|nr:helix-turn-helix domain-containing protein [Archaeoglobus sp.]